MTDAMRTRWNKEAARLLEGRTIERARYMEDHEVENMGWHEPGLVLQLDNGALVILQADDEGNYAGAALVMLADGTEQILPTLQ